MDVSCFTTCSIEPYKQFSPFGINRVLFTRLDEGLNYGAMLSFALHSRLPFPYFTTGQRVLEVIEIAGRDKAISLILN